MNKKELVAAIAAQSDLTQADAQKALKAFTDVVTAELKKGEKVQLVGFGTFEVSERAAREGRNPQTGATMAIKASKAPVSVPELPPVIRRTEISPLKAHPPLSPFPALIEDPGINSADLPEAYPSTHILKKGSPNNSQPGKGPQNQSRQSSTSLNHPSFRHRMNSCPQSKAKPCP